MGRIVVGGCWIGGPHVWGPSLASGVTAETLETVDTAPWTPLGEGAAQALHAKVSGELLTGPTCCHSGECSCLASEALSKAQRVEQRRLEYSYDANTATPEWYALPPDEQFDTLAQAFISSIEGVYGPHAEDSPLLAGQHGIFMAMEALLPDLVDDHVTPKSIKAALTGPDAKHWAPSLKKEITTLYEVMGTWRVGTPEEQRQYASMPKRCREIIMIKLVLAIKPQEDGTVSSYKSRAVARGDLTLEGVHYDDTFCGVPRFETVRFFFAVAVYKNRTVFQFDCVAAFVQAKLAKPLPARLPDDLYDHMSEIGLTTEQIGNRGDILFLLSSLYGLADAGHNWQELFDHNADQIGFKCQRQADACLYTLRYEGFEMEMTIYVDDGLYMSNHDERSHLVIQEFVQRGRELKMMGQAGWYLNMLVQQDRLNNRVTLSQPAFIAHILRGSMFGDVTGRTPVETAASRVKNVDKSGCPGPEEAVALRPKQTLFRRDLGKLLFLARLTRPDTNFNVSRLGQYASNPGQVHFDELLWLLRFLVGTKNLGVSYCGSKEPVLLVRSNSVRGEKTYNLLMPRGWSDADWAGDVSTRASRSAYLIEWLGAAIVWGSEKQACISLSTTEAELVAMSRCMQEIIYVRKLMAVFGLDKDPTFLFCDNRGALALVKNNVFHKRTKHIDIRYFFVRKEENENKTVATAYAPTFWMLADSLTKNVDEITTQDHRFFILGMDMKDGEIVFVQQFHPKSRLTTPMNVSVDKAGP